MQVVHSMVSQQQDLPEQEQGEITTELPVQVVGSIMGGVLKKVKPKNKSRIFDDRLLPKDNLGKGVNNERVSKTISLQNVGHHSAVAHTGRHQARIRKKRSRGVGREGGKLSTENSPGILPEENSGNPTNFKLGPQGGGFRRNNHQKKWSSDNIPVGSTDLAQERYSVPWLVQRREFKDTQECFFELPEPLNKRLHSPTTQKRRYPFNSTPINPLRNVSGKDENEEPPAWMEETENLEIDFNFKALGKDDKQHWEKFGKVKNSADIKVFTIADYEKNVKKEQESAEVQRNTEKEDRFMMNPLTQNDIRQAFSGVSHGDGGKTNGDFYNPDNLFAAESLSQPVAKSVSEKPVQNQVMSNGKSQLTQISPEKEEFLYSLMKGKGRSTHQSVSTDKYAKKAQSNDMIYASDLEHEHVRRIVATTKKKNQAPISRPKVMEIRHVPQVLSQQPISREAKQRQPPLQRFSNSALKENEKQKLSQMLHEKLQKYSVPPSQLAYASRSASKAVKVELDKLGYFLVPSPSRINASLTKKEKVILSFQHEIRKQYQIAIYKANEEATRYREYHQKRNQKKLIRKL